jgi:two-component system C4-dicarboxylate transport response regulator DctD
LHNWDGGEAPPIVIACAARPDDFPLEESVRGEIGASPAEHVSIIFDGVTELPARAQGELVRLLDDEQLTLRDGATRQLRVISTSDQPLQSAVAESTFRADLCARLSGVVFEVPPLRERVEEIPLLFLQFLKARAQEPIAPHARLIEKLCLYDWPFNVRELEFVARYLLLSREPHKALGASLLPSYIRTFEPEAASEAEESPLTDLRAALRQHGGRLGPASDAAGITRGEAIELMSQPSQREGKP